MFRDSRGVVHTVSSADPLTDVPPTAAAALARALLVPVEGDLGTALERCEAVTALLDRWQDAFFAGLPTDVDIDEERKYAEAAGVSLDDLERESDEWYDDELDEAEVEGQLDLDLDEPIFLTHAEDPATASLDEDLVNELERDLLLLPMRVRLEALMGASELVSTWTDLLADHEKCLGHLVLVHGQQPEALEHEALADLHAVLHGGMP